VASSDMQDTPIGRGRRMSLEDGKALLPRLDHTEFQNPLINSFQTTSLLERWYFLSKETLLF